MSYKICVIFTITMLCKPSMIKCLLTKGEEKPNEMKQHWTAHTKKLTYFDLHQAQTLSLIISTPLSRIYIYTHIEKLSNQPTPLINKTVSLLDHY